MCFAPSGCGKDGEAGAGSIYSRTGESFFPSILEIDCCPVRSLWARTERCAPYRTAVRQDERQDDGTKSEVANNADRLHTATPQASRSRVHRQNGLASAV